MYLWQVEELFGYWRKHPPTHVLMAAQLGYKPPMTTAEKLADGAQSGDEFMARVMAQKGR
jgi:hypothetical protein